jgi:hypothetical protein
MILVVSIIFLSGCNTGKTDITSCISDAVCIPKPDCHPKECINAKYGSLFNKPEVCTAIFDMTAAYSKEDCTCSENHCINKNLNRKLYTEMESQDIARVFVTGSSTYAYDGSGLKLDETITLKCAQCWQFKFSFTCSHAGYGNRSGRMLAQVITPHEALVSITEGRVAAATIDNRYDILSETMAEDTQNNDAEKFCETDSDCACGRHIDTQECFLGNKNYVDVGHQCPDFCTGIAANFAVRCIKNMCVQIKV